MVSISSSVRGISRTFYTPLYEKEMVKMIKARILYFLEVVIERMIIVLFSFDKFIEWDLGNPVLANIHGMDLIMYTVTVLIIVVSSYILLTKRSVMITWLLLLKKDLDKDGYYQAITDEIEEGA